MCTDGSAVSLYITLRNTSCSGARSHSGSRDRAVGRRPELDPCTDRLGAMARKRWLGRARAALRPLDGAKSHVASGTGEKVIETLNDGRYDVARAAHQDVVHARASPRASSAGAAAAAAGAGTSTATA